MGKEDRLKINQFLKGGEPIPQETTCIGTLYRGKRSRWVGVDGSYCEKVSVKILKSKSCPGCEKCGPMRDFIDEFHTEEGIDLSNIEEGGSYTVEFSLTGGGCPEDPYPEIDSIWFKKDK